MKTIWFHLEPQCALEWPRMAITVPGEFHEASSRGRLIDRAHRTPLDNVPGHIRSRDNFQEEPRPATHGPQSSVPHFSAIHLARQSPFYGPPAHIRLRDGIDLSPSSDPNPSRQHSRAHPLARWHRFESIVRREPLQTALQGISARAMIGRKATGRPRTCHARPSEPG